MSQNSRALNSVANYSGHPKRILRPLSALVLPITTMEKEGLVDREQLLSIQGRSRKPQTALAKEWGLVDYPAVGGGCLLTEKSFSNRLRDLLEHNPDATPLEAELLKAGRQFRITPTVKLILGRNQADNDRIHELAQPEDVLLRADDFTGPQGLISGAAEPADIETAAAIVATYGKGAGESTIEILLQQGDKRWTLSIAPCNREQSNAFLLD